MHNHKRRRRRALALLAYPALYLLTFIGIGAAEPQLWGVPVWYFWAGLVILALVPLNLLFVRYLWPKGSGDV